MALSEVQTWSSLIQSVCVSAASIGTFGLASYGVKSWLREFRGKRDTELCEEVLEKFYQAQEAIRWMRSPSFSLTELKKAQRSSSESSEQDRMRADVQVLFD